MNLRNGGAVVVGAVLVMLAAACGRPVDSSGPDQEPVPGARRIVSLSPHLTELAYAAGAGDRLIAAVEFSDFPDAARELPRIGDAFQIDFERLVVLEPDLVLAWDTGNPVAMVEHIKSMDYPVMVFTTDSPSDIAAALVQIGRIAGTESVAKQAATTFEAALAELDQKYRNRSAISVFYEISSRPLYTIGGDHYITRLIELCGGRNVFSSLTSPAAAVSFEAVVQSGPEVILVGDDIPGNPFSKWQAWPEMVAVNNRNLYTVRADLISRQTPRSADGARDICESLEKARTKRTPPK